MHPLQSQCVNYIIQRRESLASLFYLLALYGAIRGFDTGERLWYAASILCCALGIASKEIAVTAPFAIALYNRVYRSGSWSGVWRRRSFYLGFRGIWRRRQIGIRGGLPGLGFLFCDSYPPLKTRRES